MTTVARRRRPRWGGDESGQVGGIEGLVFGVLVFVLGTLIVANAWGVIDAKMAASSAAREATRTFVESRKATTGEALVDAKAAAQEAIAGHGRDPGRMRLVVEEAALRRCARVTIRVDYPVPLLSVPLVGQTGRGFTATARHAEIVDPLRSGLADSDACPQVLRP